MAYLSLRKVGRIQQGKEYTRGEYGKTSEVAKTHIESIMNRPYIGNTNPYKIHWFYGKLQANVNTLGTMGKLREIKGYVRITLDRLGGIRANLVRMDDNWKNWKNGWRETLLLWLPIETKNTSRKTGCSKHSKNNDIHV